MEHPISTNPYSHVCPRSCQQQDQGWLAASRRLSWLVGLAGWHGLSRFSLPQEVGTTTYSTVTVLACLLLQLASSKHNLLMVALSSLLLPLGPPVVFLRTWIEFICSSYVLFSNPRSGPMYADTYVVRTVQQNS